MTSKFVNYYKQNPPRNDDPSSPLPIRFPSSSRLLRKKTHQMQKKTSSLKETLTQLIELHKVGPPAEQVNNSILPAKILNSSNTYSDNFDLLPIHTPNDSPIDHIQEYVKNHTHLLESISYLLRLRAGPSAKNQSPVTFETSIEDLVQVIRLSLCSEWAAVRASALQCLRVLLRTPDVEKETYRQILNFGVDILITRSLDTGILEGGYDMEIVQALRLLYLFVQKHTSEISRPLLAALISIASSAASDNKLFRTCLALIALLAAKQPQLLQETGGIRTLVQGVLTCSDMHMNESLIASVVSLLSHPSTRLVVNLLHELQPLLAPFTDSHYIPHFFETSRKDIKTPVELERAHEQARIQAVNACACAFTSLFHSWSGMFALTQNFDSSSLRGFLEVLPLATPIQQHAMLDALFRILLIAPPASSSIDQLFDSLPSNGYDRRTRSLITPFSQGSASLSEDWVTYESERTMPSILRDRTDLALCYRVLVMSILFDTKVLVRLLETSARAPEPIIVKAIILAKEILLTLQKLFPFGLDIAELTDGSITKFLNIESRRSQSSKASKVALLLQRLYVLDRDSSEDKYSRFLLLLAKPPKLNLSTNLDINKTEETGIQQCIEDISESISRAGSDDNFASWNWAKINSLFITVQSTTAVAQKLTDTQIIRKVLQVYLPSSQLFCKLPLKDEFDYYVEAGLNLITFLLSSGRVTQLFPLLHGILDELRLFLDEEKNKKLLLKEQSMAGTLTQAYFLFLGHIAHLEWKVLLELGYPELLLQLFSVNPPNKTLVKLLLPTLVFYGSTASQSFSLLQVVALSNECQDTRVFCVKFLRTLLRCQKNNFSSQGIRLLVLLVYDHSSVVREEAIKVLDEACEIKKHLVTFSSLNPQISHLSLSGYLLFTRLFSLTDNYSLFKSTGVLSNEVKKWIQVKNFEYVELVERSIAEGFTNYVYTEPGQFKRRSTVSEMDLTKKQVFVPVHFFGQLAAHIEGCNYIKTESLMDSMIDTVKQQRLDDSADILQMKAAVWALGHIGSQKCGIELLIEENLIDDIVDMCSNSPVLTIRGSCYYSICLMAKTPVGTEALNKLGWVSVRHGNESKWPLAHDSLRDISNILDQDSLRDDISYGGKSTGSRSLLNTSLTLPEKYEFTFSSTPSQESDTSFFRSTSPEPVPNNLDNVVPHELQKVQSFQTLSLTQASSFRRRNSKDLALNPISSHCYIGLAIPVLRNSILQIPKEPVTCTRIFSSRSSSSEFNMEMKRDPNKIQIVVMDSTGKFRHRTHTGDSAFSSQSGVSGVSPVVSGIPIGMSPQKKLSSASPRGLSLKDQQGTYSTSDHSGSAAVTTENLLDAISQLSSNLSLDSKRNILLKIKANQSALFNDLQIYLQVLNYGSGSQPRVHRLSQTYGRDIYGIFLKAFGPTAQMVVAVLSNYRFSMENRKFIQALFDQSVFDSLFPDNVTIGNEEVTSSTDFISKSLTPDLLPLPTQDTIKVSDAHVEDLQARRRCSTGDAVKLKSMIKKNINDENIENREELKINIATKLLEKIPQTEKD